MSKGIPCEACEGSGKVKCKTCEGSGKVVCPTCNGSGKGYEKCPSCHNGYNIDPDDDRRVKCGKCNGTGRIWRDTLTCEKCGGSGKVACGDCQGSGSVGCSKCHATGTVSVEEFCLSVVSECGGLRENFNYDDHAEKIFEAADVEGVNGVVPYVAFLVEEECFDYLQKSAEAGYKWGELYYGELLFSYESECVKWFQKAAEQGLSPAYAYLTVIHYFGLCGKEANVAAARKAYAAATNKRVLGKWYEQYKGWAHKEESRREDTCLYEFINLFDSAMEYEDFLIRNGKKTNKIASDDFRRIWGCAYQILRPDTDTFIMVLDKAKRHGRKYMEEVLKFPDEELLFLDERVTLDSSVKNYIEEYKKQVQETEKQAVKREPPKEVAATSRSQEVKKTPCATSKKKETNKKRWKFVLLGLLFGWMGAHLMYAKRTFLLLLLWASFIVGVVMCGLSQNKGGAQVAQEASAEVVQESNNYEAIGGGCMALWLLLWLGGTLFIKKDGKGHRM